MKVASAQTFLLVVAFAYGGANDLFVAAHSSYLRNIPNGRRLNIAFGHQNNSSGNSNKNAFGLAFRSAITSSGAVHNAWPVICSADSDGDGVSNGVELGDPNCTWQQNASGTVPDPSCTTPSNPGDASAGQNVACSSGTAGVATEDTTPMDMLLLHGIVMLVAWCIFATMGAVFAILGFDDPEKGPQRFQHHWVLMTTAIVFAVSGLFFAMKYASFGSGHTWFGAIVILLAFCNPVLAWFRGQKGGGWLTARGLHRINGNTILVLAWLAALTGAHHYEHFDHKKKYTGLIMALAYGFVIISIGAVGLAGYRRSQDQASKQKQGEPVGRQMNVYNN